MAQAITSSNFLHYGGYDVDDIWRLDLVTVYTALKYLAGLLMTGGSGAVDCR